MENFEQNFRKTRNAEYDPGGQRNPLTPCSLVCGSYVYPTWTAMERKAQPKQAKQAKASKRQPKQAKASESKQKQIEAGNSKQLCIHSPESYQIPLKTFPKTSQNPSQTL